MRERCSCGITVNHEGTLASGGDYRCVMCGELRVRIPTPAKAVKPNAKRTSRR